MVVVLGLAASFADSTRVCTLSKKNHVHRSCADEFEQRGCVLMDTPNHTTSSCDVYVGVNRFKRVPPKSEQTVPVVAIIHESHVLFNPRYEKEPNAVVSFAKDSDVYIPWGHLANGSSPIPGYIDQDWMISVAISNCVEWRIEIVQAIASLWPVIQYGRCNIPGAKKGESLPKDNTTQISRHTFYLSIENSRCDEYITEKFWRPLRTGQIPIAFGAPDNDYENAMPLMAYILLDRTDGILQLIYMLSEIKRNPAVFNAYHSWRKIHRIVYPLRKDIEGLSDDERTPAFCKQVCDLYKRVDIRSVPSHASIKCTAVSNTTTWFNKWMED